MCTVLRLEWVSFSPCGITHSRTSPENPFINDNMFVLSLFFVPVQAGSALLLTILATVTEISKFSGQGVLSDSQSPRKYLRTPPAGRCRRGAEIFMQSADWHGRVQPPTERGQKTARAPSGVLRECLYGHNQSLLITVFLSCAGTHP